MNNTATGLNWLTSMIGDLEPTATGKDKVEHIRVTLEDDIPYPADFRLPPEEYARLYAEKHNEAENATDPTEDH